ncbi:hypothetical protein MJM99_35200, partial [Salmonella enterica subsp. enterica serovar Kentucky]|nr:hypothetical protein [Salmonella enterica subsp. enterica serovar Kentucky]
ITWAKKYQLDAIFSTDGDGDRPLIADEYGNWLRGDILGLLCSHHKYSNVTSALAKNVPGTRSSPGRRCTQAFRLSALFPVTSV